MAAAKERAERVSQLPAAGAGTNWGPFAALGTCGFQEGLVGGRLREDGAVPGGTGRWGAMETWRWRIGASRSIPRCRAPGRAGTCGGAKRREVWGEPSSCPSVLLSRAAGEGASGLEEVEEDEPGGSGASR